MKSWFSTVLMVGALIGCREEARGPESSSTNEREAEALESAPDSEEEVSGPTKSRLTLEERRAERERLELASRDGTMSATIDGTATNFSYFPQPDNTISTVSLAVTGRTDVSSSEAISIVVAGFNITEQDLPLKLDSESFGVAMREGRIPRQVVVTYTNSEDQEFVKQGSVRLESYGNGRLVGHIDSVELRGIERGSGTRTVTDVRFSINIPFDEVARAVMPTVGDTAGVELSQMR